MTELRELFEMTTKQKEPDLGSWQEQERRQRRAAQTRKLGAFGVVAALIGALIVFALVTRQGRSQEQPAGTPTSSASAPTGGVATHSYVDIRTGERTPVGVALSGARLPEVSPDGERIAYNTCCGYDSLHVVALDGSQRTTVNPAALDGYGPTWVDDGTILFQGRAVGTDELGDLFTVDVATGETTMVVDLPDERNGSWIVISDLSPDGSTVLFHLPRGKGNDAEWDLWTAPLAGGEPTLLRKNAGFATYASDGTIVFLDHPEPFYADALWIMDGDGSDARPVATGGVYTFPKVSPDGSTVAIGTGDDGGPAIVDIATGEVTTLEGANGAEPAWYDDDTVIVP